MHGLQVNMPYHIRVLVPCYKESYDIVTRSLEVSTHPELPLSYPHHPPKTSRTYCLLSRLPCTLWGYVYQMISFQFDMLAPVWALHFMQKHTPSLVVECASHFFTC